LLDDLTILNAVLLDLAKRIHPIPGKEIVTRIPGMINEDLYFLIANDILKPIGTSPNIADHLFSIEKTTVSQSLLQTGQPVHPTDTVSVVATLPPNEAVTVSGVKSLHAEICRLIIGAEHDIAIVNPFFDLAGREKIAIYLQDAMQRGVRIRIISRNGLIAKRPSQADIFISPLKNRSLVNVRYFSRAEASVHAKLIVADDKLAYLGSANLTGRSLSSNFEIGVVLGGPCVETFKHMFEELWRLSAV